MDNKTEYLLLLTKDDEHWMAFLDHLERIAYEVPAEKIYAMLATAKGLMEDEFGFAVREKESITHYHS